MTVCCHALITPTWQQVHLTAQGEASCLVPCTTGDTQQPWLTLVPYKLQFACQLADLGHIGKAVHYCAAIEACLKPFGAKLPPQLLVCVAQTEQLRERLAAHAAAYNIKVASNESTLGKLGRFLDRTINTMMWGGEMQPQGSGGGPNNAGATPLPPGGMSRDSSWSQFGQQGSATPLAGSVAGSVVGVPEHNRGQSFGDGSLLAGLWGKAGSSTAGSAAHSRTPSTDMSGLAASMATANFPPIPPPMASFGGPPSWVTVPGSGGITPHTISPPGSRPPTPPGGAFGWPNGLADGGIGAPSEALAAVDGVAAVAPGSLQQPGAVQQSRQPADDGKAPKQSSPNSSRAAGSWLGKVGTGIGTLLGAPKTKQAKLGLDNDFYYDETRKRWVMRGQEDQREEDKPLPPPPTMGFGSKSASFASRASADSGGVGGSSTTPMMPGMSNGSSSTNPGTPRSNSGGGAGTGAAGGSANGPPSPAGLAAAGTTGMTAPYKTARGVRSRYVDVMNSSGNGVSAAGGGSGVNGMDAGASGALLLPGMPAAAPRPPGSFFMPSPAASDGSTASVSPSMVGTDAAMPTYPQSTAGGSDVQAGQPATMMQAHNQPVGLASSTTQQPAPSIPLSAASELLPAPSMVDGTSGIPAGLTSQTSTASGVSSASGAASFSFPTGARQGSLPPTPPPVYSQQQQQQQQSQQQQGNVIVSQPMLQNAPPAIHSPQGLPAGGGFSPSKAPTIGRSPLSGAQNLGGFEGASTAGLKGLAPDVLQHEKNHPPQSVLGSPRHLQQQQQQRQPQQHAWGAAASGGGPSGTTSAPYAAVAPLVAPAVTYDSYFGGPPAQPSAYDNHMASYSSSMGADVYHSNAHSAVHDDILAAGDVGPVGYVAFNPAGGTYPAAGDGYAGMGGGMPSVSMQQQTGSYSSTAGYPGMAGQYVGGVGATASPHGYVGAGGNGHLDLKEIEL